MPLPKCPCWFDDPSNAVFSKHSESRGSAVGIATGYGLYDWVVGVRVSVGSRIFSSPRRPDRLWGPPSLLIQRVLGALPPGLKRPEHDADQSPPTSAEVRKTYTSLPHTPSWRSAQLLKHRDNFTVYSQASSSVPRPLRPRDRPSRLGFLKTWLSPLRIVNIVRGRASR
jgi:hypothetical protein